MKSVLPQDVEGIYRMPFPQNRDKRRPHIKSTLESEEPFFILKTQGLRSIEYTIGTSGSLCYVNGRFFELH